MIPLIDHPPPAAAAPAPPCFSTKVSHPYPVKFRVRFRIFSLNKVNYSPLPVLGYGALNKIKRYQNH